jgi:peptidoglycan hydrolase-like protein with peptidoglycan-binding domain
MPTLRSGSNGQAVRDLQTALNLALLPSPALAVDGNFGTATDRAVRRFQTERHITSDGLVGPITQCVLRGGRRAAPTIHNVRLIPQPTPQTCWAAATAMLKGLTPAQVIAATPPELITSNGGTANFSDSADNVTGNQRFAQVHGLHYHAPQSWSVDGFVGLIQRGPVMLSMLWDAAAYTQRPGPDGIRPGSSGHRIVVYGIDSDGDPTGAGTLVHYRDPWEPNRGRTVQNSYLNLVTETPCFTYGVFTR